MVPQADQIQEQLGGCSVPGPCHQSSGRRRGEAYVRACVLAFALACACVLIAAKPLQLRVTWLRGRSSAHRAAVCAMARICCSTTRSGGAGACARYQHGADGYDHDRDRDQERSFSC